MSHSQDKLISANCQRRARLQEIYTGSLAYEAKLTAAHLGVHFVIPFAYGSQLHFMVPRALHEGLNLSQTQPLTKCEVGISKNHEYTGVAPRTGFFHG
eukprot:SAG11_NODE_522_length_8776_cov_6.087242_1_plen_98_part_00